MQAVSEVNFSPNGKWIVSGSHDRTLKVWNASTGQMRWTLKGHKGMITDVGFSADGKRILSSSEDKTLKLWDVATGQETITLKGHTGSINYASFSPDGNRIVSGSAADRTIRVWDARSWSLEQRIVRQAAAVVRTAWQNDFTKDDVVQQIRNSQTVPVAVRRKALQLVKPLSGPTAATLNNQSWQIVRRMQSTHSESRRALRQIQAAVSLEPDNAHYRNTLGVAQYRVGDYADAADTLARSEELVRTDFGMESPLDSVVLAMALFRLGNTDAAGKRMEQLRVVARQPALSKNVEFLNFLREAEGLIGAEQEKQDRSTR